MGTLIVRWEGWTSARSSRSTGALTGRDDVMGSWEKRRERHGQAIAGNCPAHIQDQGRSIVGLTA